MSTIITRAGKGAPLSNNEVDSNFTNLNVDGMAKKPYHGVVSRSQSNITFTYASLTFTIAPTATTFDIYYQGVLYSKPSTTIVNGVGGIVMAVGLNFIYFDNTGTLQCSTTPWSLTTAVPIATVFITALTGGAAALSDERHSHTRDLDWHAWAHATVGTRYRSGLAFTSTGVAPNTFSVATGTIQDEDILFNVGIAQTTCRTWYEKAAGSYTFAIAPANYNFIWNSGTSRARYPNSASAYALTDYGPTRFFNVWVYAATDTGLPIYAFNETFSGATGGYTSAGAARAINPPDLTNVGIAPELKLLYRVIYQGNGTYVEQTDFRTSSSLPGGGTVTPTAVSVTFTPSGNISSTNVQGAVEELDLEKEPANANLAKLNVQQSFTKPQRPSLSAETAPSANVVTWDLTTDQVFRINLNAAITTFNLTGTLSSLAGNQYEVVVRFNGGSAITWNGNFKWTAATAPTLTGTSGKLDILTFTVASTDGTNYYLVNTGLKQNVG